MAAKPPLHVCEANASLTELFTFVILNPCLSGIFCLCFYIKPAPARIHPSPQGRKREDDFGRRLNSSAAKQNDSSGRSISSTTKTIGNILAKNVVPGEKVYSSPWKISIYIYNTSFRGGERCRNGENERAEGKSVVLGRKKQKKRAKNEKSLHFFSFPYCKMQVIVL